MTKNEIIKLVAARASKTQLISAKTTEMVLNSFFDSVGDCLALGEEVKIVNFGKFEPREKRPVTRRNPKTGEAVLVPAKRGVGFKPADALKNRVNEK